MSSGKWRPSCLHLNMLKFYQFTRWFVSNIEAKSVIPGFLTLLLVPIGIIKNHHKAKSSSCITAKQSGLQI